MRPRSNGLGGGFSSYGLYPKESKSNVFHVLFHEKWSKQEFEELLKEEFSLLEDEPIPTRPSILPMAPYFHRYFISPLREEKREDTILSFVMDINTRLNHVYIISSGINMGVFKGVGHPEEIAEFFCLDQYLGYSWLAHGRFPTNTPGWWGGAHPFSFLDWSVIHNGELSSYDVNRRFLNMKGYPMTQKTDTEVIVSALDYLVRQERLPLPLLSKALAPPLWEKIDRLPSHDKETLRALRQMYSPLLLNGPFSILIGFKGGMMALQDRLKLRSLVCGEEGDLLYFASEEAAIRAASSKIDKLFFPKGGELIIGELPAQIRSDVA